MNSIIKKYLSIEIYYKGVIGKRDQIKWHMISKEQKEKNIEIIDIW